MAFDVAAVTALRGYLVGQTDSQLQDVLSLYRVASSLALDHRRAAPDVHRSFPGAAIPAEGHEGPVLAAVRQLRKVIAGPRAFLPGALGQFEVVTVSGRTADGIVDQRPARPAPRLLPPEPVRSWLAAGRR